MFKVKIKRLNFLKVVLIFLFLHFSISIHADQELPLLGENSSVNLKKEDELGRGLYEKLKQKGYVIDDPLLSRYLSDIGESLLSALDRRLRDYRFYLVKDPSVNAFATPGGYVGVNIGLIAMTRNEDELAAVLAHEISHVELRHSVQMIEKAQDVNLAGMISMLAAIMISAHDSDAAGAIMYGGAAGSAQAMVNFTRTNEYEADRLGIELLKKSNYNPQAMASFMEILQRKEQSGEISNIEYIRTHPVNSNRIAEIQSRIEKTEKQAYKPRRYQQFKDYLFYLYPSSFRILDKTDFFKALELTRHGQYKQAEEIYQALLKLDPDSIWYSYAMAENLEYQQRLGEAKRLYQSMMLLYPDDLALGTRLVRVLQRRGEREDALTLAQQLQTRHSEQPTVYQLLVEIYDSLNQQTLKQLAEADYHWFNENKAFAKKLYQALLSEGQLDTARQARLLEKLDKDDAE